MRRGSTASAAGIVADPGRRRSWRCSAPAVGGGATADESPTPGAAERRLRRRAPRAAAPRPPTSCRPLPCSTSRSATSRWATGSSVRWHPRCRCGGISCGGRRSGAAAAHHGLQRDDGHVVARVCRRACAGPPGHRVRQSRHRRDRRSRRPPLPVPATRRRHGRAHQGAGVRQPGRPGMVDGRGGGGRPRRASPRRRQPARLVRRRPRRAPDAPSHQGGDGGAHGYLGLTAEARRTADRAAVPGGVPQRSPRVRGDLPDPHRAGCRRRRWDLQNRAIGEWAGRRRRPQGHRLPHALRDGHGGRVSRRRATRS